MSTGIGDISPRNASGLITVNNPKARNNATNKSLFIYYWSPTGSKAIISYQPANLVKSDLINRLYPTKDKVQKINI